VRLAPRGTSLYLHLAFVDFVAAGGEQCRKLFAAEGEGGALAVGGGEDAVDAAALVADLHAQARGDVEAAIDIDAHAVAARIVGGVGGVQPVILLLVGERAVGLDLIAVNPVRTIVADV